MQQGPHFGEGQRGVVDLARIEMLQLFVDGHEAGDRPTGAEEPARPERVVRKGVLDLAADRLDQQVGGVGRDRVGMEKPLAQPHGAERQADALFEFAVAALHPFCAAAADIEDEAVAVAPMRVGHHAGENRLGLLRAGEKLDRKPEHGLGGAEKFAAVAAVAHRAGGHGAKAFDTEFIGLGAETLQRLERARDRLGPQFGGVDQVLGQPRADAFLMQDTDAVRAHLGHDALDRIAAEIEYGVTHHVRYPFLPERNPTTCRWSTGDRR